ncbi:MAG: [FeFe] hydrogenase, group A [Endomicrobium sp.]|jgi:NADH-quinone oxidoreductase subunit G|nr:[FeFe] hydrogenase, group A [Endomicrobium sp.]
MGKHLVIDGKKVEFTDERNLLEIIRKEHIELPTFCYHSELSIHGACRLCMVEVAGRGIMSACSTPPEPDMDVKTNTEQIIEIRKITIELLLASHNRECTMCAKSESCKLQSLARRLGMEEVRFKNISRKEPKDISTYALVRDNSKCVLCGDCVRFCDEIQSVGALGFAGRGSQSKICPAFERDLESSECVYCGQCSRVCPTGAILPKPEFMQVLKVLSNEKKKVIVGIAPAVRAAIGEVFGVTEENGTEIAGKIVTALRKMGFAKVFDISFTADMTIVEEANEFLERLEKNDGMPMFTSCCPAWVRFIEQYYPDFIKNLSTCRSPQGMFGSIARRIMPEVLGIPKEELIIVSVMPCTAKKYEARRMELTKDGAIDIDYVITTQELALMIEEAGLRFGDLEASAFDMPLGFKTGGGIIFGNSGGVTEAVLRNVMNTNGDEAEEFNFVRGESGVREAKLKVGDKELKLAVVYGLKNARKVLRDVSADNKRYDFVEVMACPGGCVGGAGQPIYSDLAVRKKRSKILYENDKIMELHKPQDNPYVQKMYKDYLEKPGSKKAHEYLHTSYKYRKRFKETLEIVKSTSDKDVNLEVCVGNNCLRKGSKEILKRITDSDKFNNTINVSALICLEHCSKGPAVKIDGQALEHCTPDSVEIAIEEKLKK